LAATLKDSKRRMYSTYWDVISEVENIASEKIDISEQDVTNIVKYVGQIEAKIFQADNIIDSYLKRHYSDFNIDSWATPPVPDKDNTNISPYLRSVYVNNTNTIDPYTATWIIEITSTATNTLYSLTSSLVGNQGTNLQCASDTTSTNGDVTILSSAWENISSLTVGDKFYFSVIDVYPIINAISTMLATSMVLQSIYTEISPNASESAERMGRVAYGMLNRLQRPTASDGLRLDSFSEIDTKSLLVSYRIDDLGYDSSPYLETDSDGEYI